MHAELRTLTDREMAIYRLGAVEGFALGYKAGYDQAAPAQNDIGRSAGYAAAIRDASNPEAF